MKMAIFSVVLAFITGCIIGLPIIAYLRKLKFGQKILEVGPKWHMSKQYTPTMGGFILIIALSIPSFIIILINDSSAMEVIKNLSLLIFSLAFGVIGFIDDFTKVVKKRNLGLTAIQKLILQIVAAILFLSALRYFGFLTPNLFIPFTEKVLPISWILFLIFAVIAVVGATNAVNLTDGIDGLASSVTLVVTIFFMIVSIKVQNIPVLVFSASLTGALASFLLFNKYPAKVFMGDTGSLFLGGAVSAMAFALDMPLILIIVGIIYIIEALSVILQVVYFKISGGKRLFKMAPIHHHFEMKGYHEKKIVLIFTIITIIMCVVAYKWGLDKYFLY